MGLPIKRRVAADLKKKRGVCLCGMFFELRSELVLLEPLCSAGCKIAKSLCRDVSSSVEQMIR